MGPTGYRDLRIEFDRIEDELTADTGQARSGSIGRTSFSIKGGRIRSRAGKRSLRLSFRMPYSTRWLGNGIIPCSV